MLPMGMDSLTGGGGLTGGAATATSGDTSFGTKSYGGVNFAEKDKVSSQLTPVVIIIAAAVVAYFVLKK